MLFRRGWVALFVLILGAGPASAHGRAGTAPLRLSVYGVATPELRVPYYDTTGSIPEVAAAGVNLDAVNAAVRGAVVREQTQYARSARAEAALVMRHHSRDRGVYQTAIDPGLISASSVVVSALIPTLELYPGGNDGATWIAVTTRVPSGRVVEILDLVAGGKDGFRPFADVIRRWTLHHRPCVYRFLDGHVERGRVAFADGLDQTVSNYRLFALTPAGLVIGFPLGQICPPPAGRTHAVVPYRLLRPQLSALGTALIAGVRRPRQ